MVFSSRRRRSGAFCHRGVGGREINEFISQNGVWSITDDSVERCRGVVWNYTWCSHDWRSQHRIKVLEMQENWCGELLVLRFPCESFLLARGFHVLVIGLLFVPLNRCGYVVRFPARRGLGCVPGSVCNLCRVVLMRYICEFTVLWLQFVLSCGDLKVHAYS